MKIREYLMMSLLFPGGFKIISNFAVSIHYFRSELTNNNLAENAARSSLFYSLFVIAHKIM